MKAAPRCHRMEENNLFSSFINFGLFFMALGGFGLYEGYRLIVRTRMAYGPGQYVAVIGGLILLVGIIYYVEEIRNAKKAAPQGTTDTEKEEAKEEYPKGVVPCFRCSFKIAGRELTIGPEFFAFALFILYGVFNTWLGYLTTTILFVLLGMLLFGERIWWKLAAFAGATGAIFWYVFIRLANIPL